MRPRSQVACISDDLSIEQMVEAARRHRHTRLPIYDESPDTIVGVLNTRSLLLDPQVDLADAMELPSFVPASMNLLQLLKSLQRQRRSMAIVLDEYGGTAGLVTTEDLVDEFIGQRQRETDEPGFVLERVGDHRWRVSGTLRIDDFRSEYAAIGEVPEVETMGGLVVHLLGQVPAVGQEVTWHGLRLTVTAADERRVRDLMIEASGKKGAR
jgi:CBS domain containing-hemolysin-like protein